MLNSTPDEIQGHQRLRDTINPKMWRWKVVSGWKWLGRGVHINSLELRAPGLPPMETRTYAKP